MIYLKLDWGLVAVVIIGLLWLAAGVFFAYRFVQWNGRPRLLARLKGEEVNAVFEAISLTLIVVAMVVFWPSLLAIFFGYIDE